MATQEQIETLLKQLEKAPPSESFRHIDKNTAGLQAILKFLKDSDRAVTAGEISEHIGVSTARTAVLLKKMSMKGYIERSGDPSDARIVRVKLSKFGRDSAEQIEKEIFASIGEMIDKIGMDRMLEFAKISVEIRSIAEKPNIDL